MEFDILTIFPGMFISPLDESILKRARIKKLITINIYDLRDFTNDKHRMTDDYPYGGGSGMVMKPEPIFRAVNSIKKQKGESRTILLSPQGRKFDQDLAKELAKEERLILVCGRYEGVDERVRGELVDDEVSIGDYVLTGGELAAMVIVDAVARLIPNVLGGENSAKEDSFYNGVLEYPHYTRPFDIEGLKVPEILLSGNHEQIRLWRRKESLKRTLEKRPDLLEKAKLSDEDKKLLSEIKK